MPWLVILGDGSWMFATPGPDSERPDGRVERTYKRHRFGAGVHEVDEETAAVARDAGLAFVLVSDTEPEVVHNPGPGPLTREDVRVGTGIGVRLADPDAVPEPEADDPELPPMTHRCLWCERRFPVKAALDRHVEAEHTVQHVQIEEAKIEQAQAQDEERAAKRRIEEAEPKHLHPAERKGGEPEPRVPIPLPVEAPLADAVNSI